MTLECNVPKPVKLSSTAKTGSFKMKSIYVYIHTYFVHIYMYVYESHDYQMRSHAIETLSTFQDTYLKFCTGISYVYVIRDKLSRN